MPMTRPPYSSGFREQMSSWFDRAARRRSWLGSSSLPLSLRNWVGQADRDEGRSHDGLTSAERATAQA